MADKKINTVLYDIDQSSDTSEEQKSTARDNIDAQQKLNAGENVTIQGNTISATDTKYTAGPGLTLNGNTFAADAPEIYPWDYFASWSNKVSQGICLLDAADIASGIIKIPFDNIQWPLTTSGVQYCLCSFMAVRLCKQNAISTIASQVWKGTFNYTTTRAIDRYDYNSTPICDFSWTWNTDGSFTEYAGGWTCIIDMKPQMTGSFINLEFDFSDYKQYLEAGDQLEVIGVIWPLSLKVFNYTYGS